MNKDSVSRNQAIREYLKRHGHASVHELATAFFFSEATIRRILTELERSGQIQRTHGGAIYGPSSINERSIFARSSRNLSDKKRVAKRQGNIYLLFPLILRFSLTTLQQALFFLTGGMFKEKESLHMALNY